LIFCFSFSFFFFFLKASYSNCCLLFSTMILEQDKVEHATRGEHGAGWDRGVYVEMAV
jgi:hypothetical protein